MSTTSNISRFSNDSIRQTMKELAEANLDTHWVKSDGTLAKKPSIRWFSSPHAHEMNALLTTIDSAIKSNSSLRNDANFMENTRKFTKKVQRKLVKGKEGNALRDKRIKGMVEKSCLYINSEIRNSNEEKQNKIKEEQAFLETVENNSLIFLGSSQTTALEKIKERHKLGKPTGFRKPVSEIKTTVQNLEGLNTKNLPQNEKDTPITLVYSDTVSEEGGNSPGVKTRQEKKYTVRPAAQLPKNSPAAQARRNLAYVIIPAGAHELAQELADKGIFSCSQAEHESIVAASAKQSKA